MSPHPPTCLPQSASTIEEACGVWLKMKFSWSSLMTHTSQGTKFSEKSVVDQKDYNFCNNQFVFLSKQERYLNKLDLLVCLLQIQFNKNYLEVLNFLSTSIWSTKVLRLSKSVSQGNLLFTNEEEFRLSRKNWLNKTTDLCNQEA